MILYTLLYLLYKGWRILTKCN